MGLMDLFRPKWKHSDAAIRTEAVRQLADDDAAVLAEVARTDKDARVRRVALKKIVDASLLAEMAERDPDEQLRKAAEDKASELFLSTALGAGDEGRCLGALEHLKGG